MDNTILLAFQSYAELLGWTILHSIWQITVIALILKLLLSWTSKQDATIRYALSISALVITTFWSAHTFLGTFNEIQAIESSTINVLLEGTNNPIIVVVEKTVFPISYIKNIGQETAQLIAPILPFLAMFWFIGVLFFASRILVGFFRLHYFSNSGIQLLPGSWDTRLLTLQQLSGIRRPIKVRLSSLVESPITYQFFRPIILLPISLFTHLSAEQIEVLLLHELAHIKRQDYLVNLFQSCIEVLFFYHPLIWWMSKQVRLEREHCCDDRVMNLRHNPMLYAQTLTQIQSQHYSFKTKLAMSATGNTRDFSKRVYRLFQQKEPYSTLRNSAAALLLLLFSGAMMAFYPKHSTSIIHANPPVMVKDTVPKELPKDREAAAPQIWVTDKAELKAALQSELIKFQKELHTSVKALKEEKNKEGVQNNAKLEVLQLKASALKKKLHLKTQELEQLSSSDNKELKVKEKEMKIKQKEMKEKEKELKVKEKEAKIKQKEVKEKEKELKIKEKEAKIKQKEVKEKEKELKIKQKELKANKLILAGKNIKSPTTGLSVFPNPTRQLTNIQLNLEQKGSVKVDILNVSGQIVLNLVNEVLEKGEYQFQWNAEKQPAGSYFVHFNLDGTFMSKRAMVKK